MDKSPVKTKSHPLRQSSPTISIVVPLRNDEAYIYKCLESLVSQTWNANEPEILVVDGQSRDKSLEIVQTFAGKHRNVIVINNPRKITPVARNIGVSRAGGDYVAIIDSHSYVDPDYLEKIVAILETRPDLACVGGAMKTLGANFLGKATALVLSSPFGVGNSKFRTSDKEQLVDTTAFCVYRRSVFDSIGLFDERLARNQDNDFNYRLRRQGGNILLTPATRSYYFAPDSLRKFCRQAFRNGLWNIRMAFLVGEGLAPRHFVPLFFLLAYLGAAFGWLFGEPAALLVISTIYLITAFSFSLRSTGLRRLYFLPLLPPLFFILHSAYGFGLLAGLAESPFKFMAGRNQQLKDHA